MSRKRYGFYIDVFSYCNLRCPSCIVGNKYGSTSSWPRGVMSPEFLCKILDKALSECDVQFVGLYNWTEPLLNPNLPSLVREVKSRKLPCWLSSNLNVLTKPEELLAEDPDFFRVSLSGFTQPVYEVGHREGAVEVVKHNMERLAKAKRVTRAGTAIQVFYHCYRHNEHEVPLMEAFSHSLGFEFRTVFAQIFPVEKILQITDGVCSSEDATLLDYLALPLDRALAVTSKTGSKSCALYDEQFTLDVNGNVMLCCSTSMERTNVVGNFLELPLAELQQRKANNNLCGRCLSLGIPDYFGGNPEFEQIAAAYARESRAQLSKRSSGSFSLPSRAMSWLWRAVGAHRHPASD